MKNVARRTRSLAGLPSFGMVGYFRVHGARTNSNRGVSSASRWTGSEPPKGCVKVLNLATHQVWSRQDVTWNSMPNAPEASMPWASANTTERADKSNVDAQVKYVNDSRNGRKEELGEQPDRPTAEKKVVPAASWVLCESADRKLSLFTGAGDVTVGRTICATRAGTLGSITRQSSTLTMVMDGGGVNGPPAAIALYRMCGMLAMGTLRMPEGQASRLPPKPGTIRQAQASPEWKLWEASIIGILSEVEGFVRNKVLTHVHRPNIVRSSAQKWCSMVR